MKKTTPKRLIHLLLLLVLACFSAIAEEEDDKKTDEEKEREKQEALEKRLAEENEIKAQFEYTFNDISDKLVTISCESDQGRSSGSGFVATMKGKTYLFTNQHVILGADKISFKTAYGETLRPRGVELAASRDMARLLLDDGTAGFEITREMAVDAPIGVFGNSEGGGVTTELYGKITSVGSDRIEVSADFVSGNSGSPVLGLDQKAMGIATYIRYFTNDEVGNKTRRFCYRLTGDQWKPVNWKKYNEKYGKLYCDYEQLIESIINVTDIWNEEPYARMTADDHPDAGLRKWSAEHNRVINRIMRLSDKKRCFQHELDNTNKRIKQDMHDSAEALSAVCRNRARQMRLLSKQRELTGFLHKQFEGFADRLDKTATEIDRYGDKLSTRNFFYFK